VVEQLLGVTIGIADTVMVTTVGESAVSGVSIVDAIGILLITAFGALATGGSVVVSQYIGRRDREKASLAAKQLIYVNTLVSLVIMALTLLFCRTLLELIYGRIAADVMEAAETYFWLTALSYPALALYNSGAAIFRSMGNSRITMLVALLVNIMNIGGNAIFIYGFRIGVAGAAIATLVSRTAAAVVILLLLLADSSRSVSLRGLSKVKFRPGIIKSILNVGVPSGLESSMFQIGKILVSRIVTTFGTAAIAANAITGVINSLAFMPGQAFGMALLTVVGQSVGARDYDGAKRYTAKLLKASYGVIIITCGIILLLLEPIVNLFSLSPEAHDLAKRFIRVYCIIAPIGWPLSFALPNALRAAGDARYVMILSSVSMWLMRVSLAHIFAYPLGLGVMGVWYSMAADFCLRAFCFSGRWLRGAWQTRRVIKDENRPGTEG
jgi:putative MATE family efflux protein